MSNGIQLSLTFDDMFVDQKIKWLWFIMEIDILYFFETDILSVS